MRRRIALAAVMVAVLAGLAGAQPRRPPVSNGGYTPFRDRGFAGTSVEALALIQEQCPLTVTVRHVDRGERGVTVTMRLVNESDAPVTQHTVVAWALASDGTVRGVQQRQSRRAVRAGKHLEMDFSLTAIRVQPGDVVVLAVAEANGAAPWRRATDDIEQDVKLAVSMR